MYKHTIKASSLTGPGGHTTELEIRCLDWAEWNKYREEELPKYFGTHILIQSELIHYTPAGSPSSGHEGEEVYLIESAIGGTGFQVASINIKEKILMDIHTGNIKSIILTEANDALIKFIDETYEIVPIIDRIIEAYGLYSPS